MKMKTNETRIPGCFEILPLDLNDDRGRFVKPFHIDEFREAGMDLMIREDYYSVSKQNVLRGLHFQLPPMATKKLVTCIEGSIFDVVVDLRIDSPTYHQYFFLELSADKGNQLYIPEGLAHGFLTLSSEALVLYMCSNEYSQEHDTGIRWNSAGIPWPVKDPVISERDQTFTTLEHFQSTFILSNKTE